MRTVVDGGRSGLGCSAKERVKAIRVDAAVAWQWRREGQSMDLRTAEGAREGTVLRLSVDARAGMDE